MKQLLHLSPLPLALAIGACTVGPNYSGPPAVLPAPGTAFVRQADGVIPEAPTVADWWSVLADPVLDDLETRALAGSPDVAMAKARLDDARAALGIAKASSLPSISASAAAATIRIPGISGSSSNSQNSGGSSGSSGSDSGSNTTTTAFYNLGLTTSWEIDLFGGSRRRSEGARADLKAAEASVADAQVSLTSAVAQA